MNVHIDYMPEIKTKSQGQLPPALFFHPVANAMHR